MPLTHVPPRVLRSSRWLVALTTAALIVGTLVWMPSSAVAQDPAVSVALTGDERVLAGEDGVLSLHATGAGDWAYNLGFVVNVPVGLVALGSPVGLPRIIADPDDSARELWIFEDVADLPAAGVFNLDVEVGFTQPPPGTGSTNDGSVFPVGSLVDVEVDAYTSSDPNLLPWFFGSSAIEQAASEAVTLSASDDHQVDIAALRVTKEEPSPESELLRGVHDHTTTYEILIENTSEGTTQDAVLVDYLPAGLEFLGCGNLDNTTVDRAGDGGTNEYPGSGDLTGTPVADPMTAFDNDQEREGCLTPLEVLTVANDPNAPTDAVYTRVTWNLGDLPAGSETTLRYQAGIPLYENTITFDGDGGAPTGSSLEQTANLDNNNGAPTRQAGGHDPAGDGIVYTNVAEAVGSYQGVIRTGSDRAVFDDDDEIVYAMDLAVVKSVDREQFVAGEAATYTLDVRTSEYVSADDIVLTDSIANGLCPLVPAGTPLTGDVSDIPTACQPSDDLPAGLAPLAGASVIELHYAAASGSFTLVLAPTGQPLDASTTHQITYPVRMRPPYTDSSAYGPTTSLDVFVNDVTIIGTTTSIDALQDDDWFPDTEQVWDDSAAEISTAAATISKRVAPRDEVSSGPAPCPTGAGAYDDIDQPGFRMGDYTCFELTVNFPTTVETRNPVVTDILPVGFLDFVDWAPADAASAALLEPGAFAQDQDRIEWHVGIEGAGNDRYVPAGATLRLLVWAEVTKPAVGPAVDKPENLMKYRQENVAGEVYFLRDEALIDVEPGVSLLKGVEDVDGDSTRDAATQDAADGTTTHSNRDGIEVVEGESVSYRIDLTTPTYVPVADGVVWDSLPVGLACDDVSAAGGAICHDPGTAGFPDGLTGGHAQRSVLIWTGIDISANDTTTLRYTVDIPQGTSVSTRLDNVASVISYEAGTNIGGVTPYYPTDSLDQELAGQWNAQGEHTTDESWVFLPSVEVDKTVTTDDAAFNVDGQAVTGEVITYTYRATIPANTTVYNGVLTDALPANVAVHDVVGATFDGGALPGGFTLDTATGALQFPATYTNTTEDPQVFAVTVEAVIEVDHAYSHGQSVVNTASFASNQTLDGQPWDPVDDDATVTYVEPSPQIDKQADPDQVVAEMDVTYTLTVTNAGARPTAHETVVVDCVPTGLLVDADSISDGGTIVADATCDGTTIQWQLGALAAGDTAELSYTVSVDPAAGGGAEYLNTAQVTGLTLPDDYDGGEPGEVGDDTDETITVISAAINKSVTPNQATIGEQVTYDVEVTLPADVNFYDAQIIDQTPAGIAVTGATCDAPSTITCAAVGTPVTDGATAQTLTWDLGTVTSQPQDRTITVTYTGTVVATAASSNDDLDPVAGDQLDNTATFAWLTTPDGESRGVADDATVTVLEPQLGITKLVGGTNHQNVEPGDPFTYAVIVNNTGSSDAFDVAVTDDIPQGVVVDASTISHGGVLTDATTDGNGTITWHVDQIAVDDDVTFGYAATLASSATLDDSTLENVAAVDEYFSLPEGTNDPDRRSYEGPSDEAGVTPQFPFVVVDKDVTDGDTARVGEPFGWTLTITNTGDADATAVTATDVLPYGWTFDTIVSIHLDNDEVVPSLQPVEDTDADDRVTLTWAFDDLDDEADWDGVLAPRGSVTILFTSQPTGDAYDAPGAGVGIDNRHVNDVAVTANDQTGAPGNADGPYYGEPDDADAFLQATNVTIDKSRIGTDEVFAGDEVTFEIEVTNTGEQPAADVVVTDTLPAGLTFDDVTAPLDHDASTWAPCFVDGDTVTCALLGDLPAGDTVSFEVTARTTAAAAPTVTNVAEVTTTTPETNPDDNDDDVTVPVTPSADLWVGKDLANDDDVIAGGRVTWTVDVRNLGPSTSVAPITVTDTLPDGLLDVQIEADGWVCGPIDDQVFTCVLDGDLEVDADAPTIVIDALVDASFVPGETLTNYVGVDGTTHDPNPDNDEDTSTTDPVGALADLVISKSLASTELVAGGEGRYRIEVANLGLSDANNVVVVDQLPAGVSYAGGLTSDGDDWTCAVVAGDLECEFRGATGSLAAGGSTAFEFDVTVASWVTDEVVNVATVDASTPDPDEDNNEDEESTTPVVVTNLSVVKTHDDVTYRVGDEVTFTLVVTNHGPADAADVVVVDTLPEGLTFADVQDPFVAGSDWTCDVAADEATLTCELTGDLSSDPAAATEVLEITALVTPAAHPTATNVAVVSTSTDETTEDDNEDTESVTVAPLVDLAVTKTLDVDALVVGSIATYQIAVTNHGPTADPGPVTVVDTLPTGLAYLDHDGAACDAVDQQITCDLGALDLNETVLITVDVRVQPAAYPQVTNVVEVDTPSEDTDPTNDDDELTTPVIQPELAITKQVEGVDHLDVEPGQTFPYTVEIENVGTSDAFDVTVTDDIPLGVVVDADTITDGGVLGDVHATRGNGTITWTIPQIAEGDTVTVTYEAVLAASETLDAATLVNVASIDEYFPVDDTVPGRPSFVGPNDDAAVTPQFPTVGVVKDVTDTTAARVDEPFGWTIDVTNDGEVDAYDVTVTDTLPYGWDYGQTLEVTVDGVALLPTEQPVEATDDDGRITLTWNLGTLGAGQVAEVAFTSLPTTAAYDTPGAGVGPTNAHVNDVAVIAHDPTGASGNAVGPYGDDPDEADAFLVATNVAITKERVDDADVRVGDEVAFQITVHNTGEQPAEDVVVTDVLPHGLTFVGVDDPIDADAAQWDCTVVDGQAVCTLIDALPAGDEVSFILTARAEAAAAPAVTNVAQVTTTTPETNHDDNEDDQPVEVIPIADLRLLKSVVAPEIVVAGEPITWQVDVNNFGPSTSVAPITVVDTLPDGITDVVVDADGWVCDDIDGQELTCVLDADLPMDASAPPIQITAVVDSGYDSEIDGALGNHAVVSATTEDPNPDNDEDEVIRDDVETSADLAIRKSLVSDAMVAGEGGRYRIEVDNLGPSDARDVTVADLLPDGITDAGNLTAAGDDVWTCGTADGTLECELRSNAGTLPAGGSTWFEFEVSVASWVTAEVINVATVDSSTPDPDEDNNRDEEPTTPEVTTNLSITKTHDEAVYRVGDEVTFTVAVTNHGPADAVDVVVVDTLPAGLTFDDVEQPFVAGDGWTCEIDGATLVCSIDTLVADPDDDTHVIEVTALVTPDAYPSATNQVVVETATDETTEDDNDDTESITVAPMVDLSVTKNLDVDELAVGGNGTYEIVVTNHGPTPDPGPVTLLDVLPEGLVYTGHAGAECAVEGPQVSCDLGALDVEETVTITVDVEVAPAAYPQVINVAEVRTPSEDVNPDNDHDEVVTPVRPDVSLELVKTLEHVDEDQVSWMIAVTNTGRNVADQGFVVTDTLPDGLGFVSVTGTDFDCVVDGQVVTCTFTGALDVDHTVTLHLETEVAAEAAGATVTNVARVDGPDGSDIDPDEDDASYEVPVPEPDPVDPPDPIDPTDPGGPSDPAPGPGSDPDPSREGPLAFTGAPVWLLFGVALGLLLLGAAGVHGTRNRHQRS